MMPAAAMELLLIKPLREVFKDESISLIGSYKINLAPVHQT